MIHSFIQKICVGPSMYQALQEACYLGLKNLSSAGKEAVKQVA